MVIMVNDKVQVAGTTAGGNQPVVKRQLIIPGWLRGKLFV